MSPSAIPTRWKHWHFRSRLEARWAVFFDSLRIEFQYEPEGFGFQDGSSYLPDFYLPAIRMWAEVKPIEFTEDEKKKCLLLADASGCACLMLAGPPSFRSYIAIHPLDIEGSCERFEVDYSLDVDHNNRIYYERDHRLFSQPGYPTGSNELYFSESYRHAVCLALSQRFQGGRW